MKISVTILGMIMFACSSGSSQPIDHQRFDVDKTSNAFRAPPNLFEQRHDFHAISRLLNDETNFEQANNRGVPDKTVKALQSSPRIETNPWNLDSQNSIVEEANQRILTNVLKSLAATPRMEDDSQNRDPVVEEAAERSIMENMLNALKATPRFKTDNEEGANKRSVLDKVQKALNANPKIAVVSLNNGPVVEEAIPRVLADALKALQTSPRSFLDQVQKALKATPRTATDVSVAEDAIKRAVLANTLKSLQASPRFKADSAEEVANKRSVFDKVQEALKATPRFHDTLDTPEAQKEVQEEWRKLNEDIDKIYKELCGKIAKLFH